MSSRPASSASFFIFFIAADVSSFFFALFNGFHDTSLANSGKPFAPGNSHLDQFLNRNGMLSNPENRELEKDISMDELDFVLKN